MGIEQIDHEPEELVARYMDNPRPELKDLIMVQYSGLVERLARKYAGIEPHQDLVQVGFIGLLNALSKYDPTAGVRFTTYATHLVTGEIKHYLRDRSQTIRQPAWLQELRHKVNRTTGMLHMMTGKTPTAAEIAMELGVSESSVQEVLNTQEMLRVASLDSAGTSDEETNDMDRIDTAEVCQAQIGVEERLVLEKAMSQLRDLERQVLVHFHFDSLNQSEIAKRLGISANYVSHILRQAQMKLRRILEEEEDRDRMLRTDSSDLDFEIIDRATGSYTESFFRNRLQEELHRAASSDNDVALVVVDFKGLENLRRFYGADAVNRFLTEASEFLKGNVRRLDLVARFGPTGFGIILPYAGRNVSIVRERLAAKTMQWAPTRTGGSNVITVSIGEAWCPKDGRSVNALLAGAQSSLSTLGSEPKVG